MTSTGGTNATAQNMEVSSLCKSQSDPQCLELVTGTLASYASCLNTIGCNVARFTRLLTDEFDRAVRIVCGSANPLAKTVFATFVNSTGGAHDTLGAATV